MNAQSEQSEQGSRRGSDTAREAARGAGFLARLRVTLFFDDVLPLVKKVHARLKANARNASGEPRALLESHDLSEMPEVHRLLATPSQALEYPEALALLRHSVSGALVRFEKRLLVAMGSIHFVDVLMSLLGAVCSMGILVLFELPSTSPYHPHRVPLAVGLAFCVFLLNVGSSILHARKIDWEMLLAYRIRTLVSRFLFAHTMELDPQERQRFSTGEIVSLATQDAKHLGHYYAHGFVDLFVLLGASSVLVSFMFWVFGWPALLGLGVLVLQIPLVVWFSKLSQRQNERLLTQTSQRLGLLSEWIQGMRLVRYFGWTQVFLGRIAYLSAAEFQRLQRVHVQFSGAFALSMGWWMFVALAILGAMVWRTGAIPAVSTTFGVVWLSARLGTLLNPLPWFVSERALAKVSDARLVEFFAAQTLSEKMSAHDREGAQAPLGHAVTHSARESLGVAPMADFAEVLAVGYRLRGVQVQFRGNSSPSLDIERLEIAAGRSLAIVGEVGSGKTLLENLLMGELVPTRGTVELVIVSKCRGGEQGNTEKVLPLYSPEGLKFIRSHVAFVPQTSAVLSATVRENVTLRFDHPQHSPASFRPALTERSPQDDKQNLQAQEDLERSRIREALERSSLEKDLRSFPLGLETLIGERGINLSGGQKQRLSLSRAHFLDRPVVIFDDPLSAVDRDTETQLLNALFEERPPANEESLDPQTMIVATHRLGCIERCDDVLLIEQGRVVCAGPVSVLLKTESPLAHWIRRHES